jgi:hypothetical protein
MKTTVNFLLIFLIVILVILWTGAIYFFGWWGAITMLTIGIAGTLWIEIKGLS